jgi:NADH-quinone oxidoreductase subunit J
MALAAIAFYLLGAVTIGAALRVVTARNPVHSVLFLILTFFSAAGLFVLLGAEFIAMLLVVVYVGAVAVLFLFVVMMLDVDFAALRAGFVQYLPLGGIIALVIAGEMVFVSFSVAANGATAKVGGAAPVTDVTNAEAIGRVLYTDYFYFFQASGLVLLVAMIGAIVLTLRQRANVRRQVIADQVARTPATGVRLVSLKSGEGLQP